MASMLMNGARAQENEFMLNDSFYKLQNPLTQYYNGGYSRQVQEYPGIQGKMSPVPDCGEKTYRGTGRLKDRKALVTGGDSGIGRAAAIAYAREGADVAIAYLPAEEPDAQEVKQVIESSGRKALLIPGDLKHEKYNTKMVETAVKEFGSLDILAMVAGRQIAVKNIENISTEQLLDVFSVNVFSMFWTVKAALPHMPEGATIITTSSIQAYDPSSFLTDYAATKAAIKNFTESLAKQLAPKGIRVNCVAPGPVWTPLQISGGQLQENIPDFGASTPLERAGQPAEFCGVYVFLASPESSYVTGQVIGVTGGKPT